MGKKAVQVDDIVGYLERIVLEAVLGETALKGHLTAFKTGTDTAAGAGVLTLVTLAGSSAKAGSTATAYTAAGLALFRKGKEVIKLHYNTPQMAIVT